MLTKNEVNALNLSATKKDFVQIWNELLEVSGKLSERWDPTSTNESDPGIVILKALTGIADKLNYNIDKNILEAFMPTAAQEESMRKLCEMLGYSIKYYQSAQTDVVIKYYNAEPEADEQAALEKGLAIPKFTVLTNADQDINYFTINQIPYQININSPSVTIPCMEGQIVKCESINENNVITVNQISEDNRFYLPETQIAENGIFIYNVFNNTQLGAELVDGAQWEKVDNLNTQVKGSRVFKFGYDSYESRPYLEFPDDFSSLFGEGIFIYYARTNGVNGNISTKTLTQLELPKSEGWDKVSIESFSVENTFAANTGANPETIKQAYRNFKKTIGTFDTLVTCRDYMNKIYSLISDYDGKPLVSNVLVTDIRSDLNKAVTICSCDDSGIFYKDVPIYKSVTEPWKLQVADKKITHASDILEPKFDGNNWFVGGLKVTKRDSFIQEASAEFDGHANGTVATGTMVEGGETFYTITQGDKTFFTFIKPAVEEVTVSGGEQEVTIEGKQPLIDHFDLILYPYKVYNQIKANFKDVQQIYDASFTYNDKSLSTVKNKLELSNLKTLAHNLRQPETGDIVSINNYLKLNAVISTTSKITAEEGTLIIEKIKVALANAFNMRELDFGEEIPFDSILEIIEKADSKIKAVSLNIPELYTTFSVIDSIVNNSAKVVEYAVKSKWFDEAKAKATGKFFRDARGNLTASSSTFDVNKARQLYNILAARNVLAGRVSLFKTSDTFKTDFSEIPYRFAESLATCPDGLVEPSEQEPYTTFTDGDITYVGYWSNGEKTYEKISTPEVLKNGVISNVGTDNITEISTVCELKLDSSGSIENEITLEPGEVVKFRAPNFVTRKTYPAYVNYNLVLANDTQRSATPAVSSTLFSILDSDREIDSVPNDQKKWQKVLNYFKNVDSATSTTAFPSSFVKTFPLSQTISKYSPTAPTESFEAVQTGPIILDIENTSGEISQYSLEDYFKLSGCVKLKNHTAKLVWDPKEDETKPAGEGPTGIEIIIPDTFNPFITDISVLNRLKTIADQAISERIGKTDGDGDHYLPTECSWKVVFEFECVPFESASLNEWEKFIKLCAQHRSENSGLYKDVIDFVPKDEFGTILWRAYASGSSTYDMYTTRDFDKMLTFGRNHFGLLNNYSNNLLGIYLISQFGTAEQPSRIKNNSEYELQHNEFLYIEYTPSSTTEDGTTENLPSVTEKLGPGTIIRPNGFETETGLVDSRKNPASSFKTVDFYTDNGIEQIQMHTLGANEQIEIRDFARTELNRKTFSNLNGFYVYKNFDCEVLENANAGQPRTYTLKDGEYIFYTDKNKAELAYFTSGTQVTLYSNVCIPVFEKIDIASIFDAGIGVIPWEYVSLINSQDDRVVFQEYQYITLTGGDTLKQLTLASSETQKLDETWRDCLSAEYILASETDKTKSTPLPPIRVYTPFDGNNGRSEKNGWQACSLLELNVSSSEPQLLRNTDAIATGISLHSTSSGGSGSNRPINIPDLSGEATDPTVLTTLANPVYFKTNLPCQVAGNKINIKEIFYNPKDLKGFELKFFEKEPPAIVKTAPGRVVPYKDSAVSSILSWPGEPLLAKSVDDIWTPVDLDKISVTVNDVSVPYDNALRLSSYILPKTYGMVCFYVKYANSGTEASTWIELAPGTPTDAITYFDNKRTTSSVTEENASGVDVEVCKKLVLDPGMNCLRINKSCRFFVKSSDQAKGQLLFDDINIVPIDEVSDASGNKLGSTLGLNLEQLGYLDTDATSSDGVSYYLDTDTKEYLQKQYVETALESLSDEEPSINKDSVKDYYFKLAALTMVENAIKDELANLDNSSKTELKNLYAGICDVLGKEHALKQALEKDTTKDLSGIEKELTSLLQQRTPGDTEAEKTLNNIIEKASADLSSFLNNLSKEQLKSILLFDLDAANNILVGGSCSNFDALSNKAVDKKAILDIQADIKDKVNKLVDALNAELAIEIENEFTAGLQKIKTLVDNTVTASQREELNSTLEQFMQIDRSNKYMSVALKAKQLSSAVDTSQISNEFSSAISYFGDENAGTPTANPDTALTYVQKLIEQLKSSNTDTLVTELNNALENSDEQTIQKIVDDITTLQDIFVVESSSNITAISKPTLANVISQLMGLSNLISAVSSENSENWDWEEWISKLKIIKANYDAYVNLYANDCLLLITNLNELVGDSEGVIEVGLKALKDSQDSQIALVADQLENLVAIRDNLLINAAYDKLLDINSYDVLLDLGFVRKSLVAHIEARITNFFDVLKRLAIEGILVGESLFEPFTETISALIVENLEATGHYNNLINSAVLNATYAAQEANITDKLEQIISKIPGTSDVSDAMTALNNAGNTQNAVLRQLITEISKLADDITTSGSTSLTIQNRKAELYEQLKIELDSSILKNETLKKLLTQALCPTLAKYAYSESVEAKINDKTFRVEKSDKIFKPLYKVLENIDLLNASTFDFEKWHTQDSTLFVPIRNIYDGTYLDIETIPNTFDTYLNMLVAAGTSLDFTREAFKAELFEEDPNTKIHLSRTDLSDVDISTIPFERIDLENVDSLIPINIKLAIFRMILAAKKAREIYKVKQAGLLDLELDALKAMVSYLASDPHLTFTDDLCNSLVGAFNDNSINKIDNSFFSKVKTTLSTLEEQLAKLIDLATTSSENPELIANVNKLIKISKLEQALLRTIKELDHDNNFYYNMRIEDTFAIEFNESEEEDNTLLNPRLFYDVNNVNNNFVISKLDIKYLDSGLQIARSSRLN